MKRIKLTQDKFAIVDDKDYEYLSRWSWQLHTGGYAYRGIGKNSASIYMHREVNKTPDGLLTDHINGDKLDNRQSNLRTADRSLNAINTGIRSTNTSGHKGVSWNKQHSKWESYIWKDNKKYNLGIYEKLIDATESRKKAELIYHG